MMNKEKKEVTLPILLNSTHYVNNSDSTYRYKFPSGGVSFDHGDTVSLVQVSMYYSIFNITAANKNNTIDLIFGGTTYSLTIEDGSYSIAAIQNRIEAFCRLNGLYLEDDRGNPVYYVVFTVNPNRYRVQLDCLKIPVDPLPDNRKHPNGFPTIPGAGFCPQVLINSEGFGNLIGFDVGTYPVVAVANNSPFIGQKVPQIHLVQSMIIKSNIISNGKYSIPTDMMANFPLNNSIKPGEILQYIPNDYSYVSIRAGKYEHLEISFIDQIFRPIKIQDTDLTVMLLLKISE